MEYYKNFIKCYKKCSCLRNLQGARDFIRSRSIIEAVNNVNKENTCLLVARGAIKCQQYWYQGDVLDCEADVVLSKGRVWYTWERSQVVSLQVNLYIVFRSKKRVYEPHERSFPTYRVEKWGLTNREIDMFNSCNHRILKHKVGVR